MASNDIFAGVELGGTKCVAILARGPDDVLARETLPTTSPEETLGRIEEILTNWRSEHGFATLGIASFGPSISMRGRRITVKSRAPRSPAGAGRRCATASQRATAVPTAFDTDVNGAALAEMRWGSGRGFDDFAYVTVGTGVGVGLIVNGKPTRGFAHCELGHIRVARLPGDEFAGSCPYHGDCVEGLAAGPSLEARAGDRVSQLEPDDPALALGRLDARAAVPRDCLRRRAARHRHWRRRRRQPAAPAPAHRTHARRQPQRLRRASAEWTLTSARPRSATTPARSAQSLWL